MIADDAHSAENYVASLWSVRIDRTNKKHKALHNALANFLSEFIGDNADRLSGVVRSTADLQWTDKIPSPTLEKIYKDILDIIDKNANER